MKKTDVCAEPGTPLFSVDDALNRIHDEISPIEGIEHTTLKDSLGRVLAQDLLSPLDSPLHRNSAMDGYALISTDIPPRGSVTLAVVGTSWAGRPYSEILSSGQSVRIFTGAVVPEPANTVVMQEAVNRSGDRIEISSDTAPGDYIREPGEDIRAGQRILTAGRRLDAADLGVLASIGIAHVTVRRRLRVAFFSTGDELRPLGSCLKPGEIYESNRYTLYGLLQPLPVEALDMGVIPDQNDALHAALSEAASISDVIITSGGVSVGEADRVKQALEELGQINFWKIAMKPGKPLAFGRIDSAWFFGLPGNPVSVMVTFMEIVRPALLAMIGSPAKAPLRLHVPCRSDLRKVPGRLEFQRGILIREKGGALSVTGFGTQGSHILSSMSRANCFIILPAQSTGVKAGAMVEVEPFSTTL